MTAKTLAVRCDILHQMASAVANLESHTPGAAHHDTVLAEVGMARSLFDPAVPLDERVIWVFKQADCCKVIDFACRFGEVDDAAPWQPLAPGLFAAPGQPQAPGDAAPP